MLRGYRTSYCHAPSGLVLGWPRSWAAYAILDSAAWLKAEVFLPSLG